MATNAPVPGKIMDRARKLAVGIIIELYILDASGISSAYTGLPGPVYCFHNCDGQGSEPLVFQGVAYSPFPFQSAGFDVNAQGKLPRPTINIANIGGVFSSLLREFDDLVSAKLTRKRTLFEFLDFDPRTKQQFPPYGAPMATSDSTQEMPSDVFYIDRKAAETKKVISFELSANFDVQGIMLPRRQLTANSCTSVYRKGDGCDYTGPAATDQYGVLFGHADTTGTPSTNANYGNLVSNVTDRGAWNAQTHYATNDQVYLDLAQSRVYYVASSASHNLYPAFNSSKWAADICLKTLSSCRLRFGQKAVLPFEGFPAILRAPLST